MARIASTVADLIGGTPLVRIQHVAGDGVDVVAKVEAFNPASSVKDRIARSIIDAAEASGALAPGGTIVEAPSGNTPCRWWAPRAATRSSSSCPPPCP